MSDEAGKKALEYFKTTKTCVVCTDVYTPPVRQCSQGHLVCNNCYLNIQQSSNTNCPQCREPFAARCRYVESFLDVMKLTCSNKHAGCEFESFEKNELEQHEKHCHFRLTEVHTICKLMGLSCNFVGTGSNSQDAIVAHLIKDHNAVVSLESQTTITHVKFKEVYANSIPVESLWSPVIFKLKGTDARKRDIFVVYAKTRGNDSRQKLTWTCISLNDEKSGELFYAKIQFNPLRPEINKDQGLPFRQIANCVSLARAKSEFWRNFAEISVSVDILKKYYPFAGVSGSGDGEVGNMQIKVCIDKNDPFNNNILPKKLWKPVRVSILQSTEYQRDNGINQNVEGEDGNTRAGVNPKEIIQAALDKLNEAITSCFKRP